MEIRRDPDLHDFATLTANEEPTIAFARECHLLPQASLTQPPPCKYPGCPGRCSQGIRDGVEASTPEVSETRHFLVERRDRYTLLPIILKHIQPGTKIRSDEWGAYQELHRYEFTHEIVNHSQEFGDSVNGYVVTNLNFNSKRSRVEALVVAVTPIARPKESDLQGYTLPCHLMRTVMVVVVTPAREAYYTTSLQAIG
ncbi:unnamed protein product [Darwinula stevensoni]|uniref:ISXO2-like transposase domain-containing protein n=1 Tax=Darwinula stevensoni TaxID=69355 RepID=A0A7R9A556_9CRUS|nr:unnamed protein product [Darwinula stevensoni]CAG0891376.1 unnamed protein product [Darwinula stevensoni]